MANNTIQLESFFEGMGMMVRSGIPLSEASAIMRDETDDSDGRLREALCLMTDRLEAGAPLGEALRETGAFPGYAADVVDAAEYTGNLEDALFHLSSYYSSERKMNDALRSAVRYPFILLLMTAAVLIAMIGMVFPAFYGVYENLAGSISASSYGYINISFALCRIMLVLIAVMLAVSVWGVRSWKHGGRDRVRAALSNISSFRKLFESMDLYRFSSSFAMFLTAGETQDEALRRSTAVAETAGVRERLGRVAGRMSEGLGFSRAAYEEELYERSLSRLLIPAERSGMLDSAMRSLSEKLRIQAEGQTDGIADTAEPLITGLLMIIVGIMLISIMLPLIGIMNSIG